MSGFGKVGHKTVLLQEAVEFLVTDPAGFYIDGTFGRGGHSRRIVESLSSAGKLLAFDRDPEAVEVAEAHFSEEPVFEFVYAPFGQMLEEVRKRGWAGRVNGVLLDLGVSSPQLDQPERGFSFMHDGPLDMRMDTHHGVSAAQWLASASVDEMISVFRDFGEERYAKRIAGAIDRERQLSALETTAHLAKIVAEAHPAWEKGKHPATRVFQAIRIHINGELEQLQQVLDQALEILGEGGRLVVISFHSLEDRMVKQFMRRQSSVEDDLPARLPVRATEIRPRMRLVGKAIKASSQELAENVRARSAVMRVAEKVY
ncbi:MAG: 16S rRNA (cytosine(1402)-N(4))-methyltransferase RsmH [Pseudomonadales bacterium]|nr:16S rRNA (cytosine(1402)-N(4))-methyltransferase RsmH [Pseudomonadales bacterium]